MLDILMITYNRAAYTRMSLQRLLDSCDGGMRVWVWHNGTDAETLETVRSFSGHRAFFKLHVSPENKRLREPTNWFWENSAAEFLSKVDDDCLVSPDWARPLLDTHRKNPRTGVLGCWRFYDEDFVPELARKKIRLLNGDHKIMENCWVQGSGYVLRRQIARDLGGLRPRESFPAFCIRSAVAGWKNGWYFPFIHEEHMDDPRSPYCEIKTDEQFMAQRPLSAVNDNVTTVAEWARRVKYMARTAQAASPRPWMHYGLGRRLVSLQSRIARLFGAKEPWRAQ